MKLKFRFLNHLKKKKAESAALFMFRLHLRLTFSGTHNNRFNCIEPDPNPIEL